MGKDGATYRHSEEQGMRTVVALTHHATQFKLLLSIFYNYSLTPIFGQLCKFSSVNAHVTTRVCCYGKTCRKLSFRILYDKVYVTLFYFNICCLNICTTNIQNNMIINVKNWVKMSSYY